jgi:hypothetical protein
MKASFFAGSRKRFPRWAWALGLTAPLCLHAETPRQEILIHGVKATVWASSALPSPNNPGAYSPKNAFDGDLSTAWVEGAPGPGVGEWLQIELESPKEIAGIILWPGYLKNYETLHNNALPRVIEVRIDDKTLATSTVPYSLEDDNPPPRPHAQDIDLNGECFPTKDTANFSPRILFFRKMRVGKTIKLVVKKADYGFKFDDLAISDIDLIFASDSSAFGKISFEMNLIQNRDSATLSRLKSASLKDLRNMVVFGDDSGLRYENKNTMPKSFWETYGGAEERKRCHGDLIKCYTTPRTHCSRSAFQCWLNELDSTIFNSFSTYVRNNGKLLLIGRLGFTFGDSEWIEMYPTIEFEENGIPTGLTEFLHFDGAAGCKDVIPGRRKLK